MCNGQPASCTLASCPRCRLPVLPEFCGDYIGATTGDVYRVWQDTPAYVEVFHPAYPVPHTSYPVDMFRDLADAAMIRPLSEGSN